MIRIKKDKKVKILKEISFRISTKNLLLTYNPCFVPLDEVLDQLKEKLDKYIVLSYLLVKEIATIENSRVHIYIRLYKRCDIKPASRLNLINDDNTPIHGNYQSVKYINKTVEYMLKDVENKDDENIVIFSDDLSSRITKLGCFLSLDATMIKLAEEGQIKKALELLKKL